MTTRTTRLPPIPDDELRRLYEKLALAGQVVPLAQTQWPNQRMSVRELVEKIQGEAR